MFKKIGNLISNMIGLAFLSIVLTPLAIGGYFFGYKANQPMEVEEAQKVVPGMTYNEFWATRIQQAEAWDDKAEAGGKKRTCVTALIPIQAFEFVFMFPAIAEYRMHADDPAWRKAWRNDKLGPSAPDAILLDGPYLDAVWVNYEHAAWNRISEHPGIPTRMNDGSQVRRCSMSLPVLPPSPVGSAGIPNN